MAKTKSGKTAPKTEERLHWAEAAAEQAIGEFPDAKTYTVGAGISPSGVIHFGNFRDVMTSYAVMKALQARGKPTRFVFTWDEYDRFRKVPTGVDPKFEEHIGKPLSEVPDPHGDTGVSYAQRFERLFEGAMKELGIGMEYRYQAREYAAGAYDDRIIAALKSREKIADVLLSFMSDKAKGAKGIDETEYRNNYYPVSVYSAFTGKDITRVTGYDDDRTLTYDCIETGKSGRVVIGKDRNLKLAWKVDWAMRWAHEEVVFEPAGADHASPGSSYDVSSRIIREVFDRPAPVFVGYGMVGLQGEAGKMSGSAGTGISPSELLSVYEAPMLRWLYLRKQPKQNFSLAFDTEIYRQYDEFDREVAARERRQLDPPRTFALEQSFADPKEVGLVTKPIPFRQLVSLGQIVQWDETVLKSLLESLEADYDEESIKSRLPKARNWLEQHNPDQLISLLEKPNAGYIKRMPDDAKARVRELADKLGKEPQTVKALEDIVYGIPKDSKASDEENRKRQRAFFADVYQLLIGKDTGPRLSTFLWAIDRKKALKLLTV